MTKDIDLQYRHTLAPGDRLDDYEIRSILGWGGFGVVYQAYDRKLDTLIAIKEYMPRNLVKRDNGMTITPIRTRDAQFYQDGLEHFIKEGSSLAKFDHPNIVKVYRVLEANNTAYLVMPFYLGETLKAKLETQNKKWDEESIRRFAEQLLDALSVVHKAGLCHRDISPDNILIKQQLEPKPQAQLDPMLLDFGGARRYLEDQTHIETALVKDYYSPPEQYGVAVVGRLPQGPWSDIYSLSAVLYHLVSGEKPYPAHRRLEKDQMPSLIERRQKEYSKGFRSFLKAVDWGLTPDPLKRPQTVEQWRKCLLHGKPVPPPGTVPETEPPAKTSRKAKPPLETRVLWPRIVAGLLVANLALAFAPDLFEFATNDTTLRDEAQRTSQDLQTKHESLKNAVATTQSDLNLLETRLSLQNAGIPSTDEKILLWNLRGQLAEKTLLLQLFESALRDEHQGLSAMTRLEQEADQAQQNHQDQRARELWQQTLAGYWRLGKLPERLAKQRAAERAQKLQAFNGRWAKETCDHVKTWVVDFPKLTETNPDAPTFEQRIVQVGMQEIIAVVTSSETYQGKSYQGRVYRYQIDAKTLISTQLEPVGKSPVRYQACS